MASSNKHTPKRVRIEGPLHPEKVVVNTGPTFGTAVSFMLLGVAIGAGAVFFVQSRGGTASSANAEDAVQEGLTGGGAKAAGKADQLMDRLNTLTKRVRSLATETKETLGPALSEAVSEGRKAARETQDQLHNDLHKEAGSSVAKEQA